ncbi:MULTISPECIES: catalase family peroxidase [Planomicrobium]|uniref:catalase family peroxidase n=1 Tax=Planomicrobium TaxID=162291 RepID=UPI000C7B2143|nr:MULTISPECIES: catalase family peroxidase [Planomicrobium]PKH10511.1 catalase [Planomicrobium sp. MB-3u-38]
MADERLAETAVNKIEKVFGEHETYRRAHSRGIGYRAVFTANGEGKKWTVAQHLREGETKAVVRFSHSAPDPFWTDNLSPVKGMAVQFQLPDGQVMNSVGVTSPIFFSRTPEVFTEMLDIAKSFKKGRLRLRDLITLFIKYPESRAAIRIIRKMQSPASFATGLYHSIHAFYLVNGTGQREPVKFQWQPEAGEESLNPAEAASVEKGDFEKELEERVVRGETAFRLIAVIGDAGDPVDDPTKDWAKDRKKVELGRLVLMEKTDDAEGLLFDPTVLAEGVECTDDPILHFRNPAYAVSYMRREKEKQAGRS